jgi:hypothetical protein
MIQAVKASGVIVRLEPQEFGQLLRRIERPLIVTATGFWGHSRHQYLTAYRGLAFYTRGREPVALPAGAEIIASKRLWVPG